MYHIWHCRRTFLAVFSIVCLMVLALFLRVEVASFIVAIVVGITGANAAQKVMTKDLTSTPENQNTNLTPEEKIEN